MIKILDNNDIARFWSKVKKQHYKQCWLWVGGIHWAKSIEVRHQYGIFHAKGKKYKAHRVSYVLKKKRIPKNHVVRHTCDTPRCVNPHHLITGTQLQNDMDRTVRGRSRNGHTGRIK